MGTQPGYFGAPLQAMKMAVGLMATKAIQGIVHAKRRQNVYCAKSSAIDGTALGYQEERPTMPAQTRILDFQGQAKLIQTLKTLGARAQTIVGAALLQEAEKIMTESKRQCPVDLGNLRDTGHVTEPEVSGGHVSVTLGYGGPAAPYAIVQHERLDFQHKVGKAKFLEDPLLEAANGLETRLAQSIKRGIEDAAR